MTDPSKPVVLITGASGLIGSELSKAFAPGFQVVGLDVKPPKTEVAGSDFIECDLTKDESAADVLRAIREKHGDRIASVLHLAAYYDFSGNPVRSIAISPSKARAGYCAGFKDFRSGNLFSPARCS